MAGLASILLHSPVDTELQGYSSISEHWTPYARGTGSIVCCLWARLTAFTLRPGIRLESAHARVVMLEAITGGQLLHFYTQIVTRSQSEARLCINETQTEFQGGGVVPNSL